MHDNWHVGRRRVVYLGEVLAMPYVHSVRRQMLLHATVSAFL